MFRYRLAPVFSFFPEFLIPQEMEMLVCRSILPCHGILQGRRHWISLWKAQTLLSVSGVWPNVMYKCQLCDYQMMRLVICFSQIISLYAGWSVQNEGMGCHCKLFSYLVVLRHHVCCVSETSPSCSASFFFWVWKAVKCRWFGLAFWYPACPKMKELGDVHVSACKPKPSWFCWFWVFSLDCTKVSLRNM